jgi:biotin synthase
MNDQMQALCFLAGANSIFYGERLLTTDNPEADRDRELLERLGMRFEQKAGHAGLNVGHAGDRQQ